jgi:hypothetical protein
MNNVSWRVNWRKIFGNRVGECKVRAHLITQSSVDLSEEDNENTNANATVGSIYTNFLSNTSDITYGFNLGTIRPVHDPTKDIDPATNPSCTLELDTRCTNGLSMVIPDINNQNAIFNIRFMDAHDKPMDNVPEYQIWFYFDVHDDIPVQPNVEKSVVSYF